ncbi:MAG TPA: UvrD-helicase domain-containing protein [Flavisolibacter sp.]|nr:UvrD-helicase domain-containing protein [Flavisolibacter sp.]
MSGNQPISLQLTTEQEAIICSSGDIKINAVAGSGKTTTIIEYARTRPAGSKILYLAFNRTVKLEAQKRFAEKGMNGVQVETAHSLAYKKVMYGSSYKVASNGYKTHEIADLLQLQSSGEKHAEYVIANHINRFTAYFCNSDKEKVQELNYLDVVADGKAKAFVSTFYKYIEDGTRMLLAKMNSGEIDITHDFYLKKFQLSRPKLHYDYILFDEGQDASPAMLHVFLRQAATKVIVGDAHQQIYGWRYAVNSLEKTNFQNYYLTTSFRFTQAIGDLAAEVLSWKKILGEHTPVTITGQHSGKTGKSNATLARTNLGLLLRAIEYITENKEVARIYFEGNINSYTYADEGASLYDVLNLYNKNHKGIRDRMVQSMKDLAELEDYIEKTEDQQLMMMVEIVKEYGNSIPAIIKSLKEKHVGDEAKTTAEMIFSTVHRCKGMEYDAVQLVNDFITQGKLERLKEDQKNDKPVNLAKSNEEINLLYVAVTRTKGVISIPEALMPKDFPASPQIRIIKPKKEPQGTTTDEPLFRVKGYRNYLDDPVKKLQRIKDKAVRVEKEREVNKQAYLPWTEELDSELKGLYYDGVSIVEIAKQFGRTESAIVKRLKRLDCLEF